MVIREDSDGPMELPISRPPAHSPPLPTRSKFVVVRNHVRELKIGAGANAEATDEDPNNHSHSERKKKKKGDKTINAPSADVLRQDSSSTDPLEKMKDLEELRNVYFQCKNILSKIERKYGESLNLKIGNASRHKRKCKEGSESPDDDSLSSDPCCCERNTKIVFDDGGNEILTDTSSTHHICVRKPTSTSQDSLQVEYGASDSELPDSLAELSKLLRNDTLPATRRNAIISKIRILRLELGTELRYHRAILLEHLRQAPSDVFDFPGTNLFSLSGYS